MGSTHRIYLNMLKASPQQVDEPTRWYYDINANDFKDTPEARWYRVTSASAGTVYDALLQVEAASTSQLGGHMQLFGSRWYVEAGDVDLGRAHEIRLLLQPTHLQLLAFAVVLLGMILLGLVRGQYVQIAGQAPGVFPSLACVAGIALALMAADFIAHKGFR